MREGGRRNGFDLPRAAEAAGASVGVRADLDDYHVDRRSDCRGPMKQDAVTDAPKEPRRWTLHEVRGVVESVCPWADPSRCLDRHEHLESVEAAAFDALAAKLAATEEAFEIAERQLAEAEKRIGGLISQRDAAELKLAEAERELFLMRRVAEGNEAEKAPSPSSTAPPSWAPRKSMAPARPPWRCRWASATTR